MSRIYKRVFVRYFFLVAYDCELPAMPRYLYDKMYGTSLS